MSHGKTILLVEDDPDVSDAIASCLEDHGYEIMVAANGREALERLRQVEGLPRLILLDLMMPVMDGWQFRAAQRADPALAAVPVVLLSAHVGLREAAAEMGALHWLKKPLDLDALLAVVERA
jgi:CheY-like chemotaxis protein